MKIDITPIKEGKGLSLVRDVELDLAWEDREAGIRLLAPWRVHAKVVHAEAGYLLTGKAQGSYMAWCDRCLLPLEKEMAVTFSECFVPVYQGEQGNDDECRLLENDQIDLKEVILEKIILELPMKHLCSTECAGLCPHCGVNLNEETCACKAPPDPRLSKLSQLLEPKGGGQNG